jgi:hypothetical protein
MAYAFIDNIGHGHKESVCHKIIHVIPSLQDQFVLYTVPELMHHQHSEMICAILYLNLLTVDDIEGRKNISCWQDIRSAL